MFECSEMKELFVPELYWRNPYNLFALPISATPREIRRKREDIESSMYSMSVGEWACTALRPKRLKFDKTLQDDAFESLKEPVRRLFYSFFWFWSLTGISEKRDEACTLIVTGRPDDRKEALSGWSCAASFGGRSSLIAKHNLAIYFHLIALIFEDSFERGGNVTSEDCDRYWNEAIRLWNELADDDEFWDIFSDYVRGLDDPTLTTGMVRRLRHDFPLGFDQINALLLKHHLKTGEIDDVRRQLRYMKASQEGLDDLSQTLDEVVDYIEKDLDVKAARIRSQVEHAPERGLDLAREILALAENNLSVLSVVVGTKNHRYIHIADELTVNVLHCQVSYAKQTDDWESCIKVLEDAIHVAASESAKKRLEKNLSTVRDNFRYAKEQEKNKPIDDFWQELHEFLGEKFERIKEDGAVGLCLAEAIIAHADTFRERARELYNTSHDIDFRAVSDEIARAILACAVAYGNKTDDWKRCLPLLDKARGFAVAPELLQRINMNVETLKHNIMKQQDEDELRDLMKICWCCKRNVATGYHIVRMSGDTHVQNLGDYYRNVEWTVVDVPVPICNECVRKLSEIDQRIGLVKQEHEQMKKKVFVFLYNKKLALINESMTKLETSKKQIIETINSYPIIQKVVKRNFWIGDSPFRTVFMGRRNPLSPRPTYTYKPIVKSVAEVLK